MLENGAALTTINADFRLKYDSPQFLKLGRPKEVRKTESA